MPGARSMSRSGGGRGRRSRPAGRCRRRWAAGDRSVERTTVAGVSRGCAAGWFRNEGGAGQGVPAEAREPAVSRGVRGGRAGSADRAPGAGGAERDRGERDRGAARADGSQLAIGPWTKATLELIAERPGQGPATRGPAVVAAAVQGERAQAEGAGAHGEPRGRLPAVASGPGVPRPYTCLAIGPAPWGRDPRPPIDRNRGDPANSKAGAGTA